MKQVAIVTALGIAAAGMGWEHLRQRRKARAAELVIARYQALTEHSPDAVIVRTADRIRFANVAAAKLLGFASPADLIAQPYSTLVPANERVVETARSSDEDRTGLSTAALRRHFLRRDGTVIETEVRSAPIAYAGESGETIGIRDLTSWLEDEKALRASEARYRALLDVMNDGVVLQNEAMEIVLWNPAAERILGLSGDQLTGRTSYDPRWRAIDESGASMPGDAHPATVAMRTGEPARGTMGIERKPGDLVWLAVSAMPLRREGESMPYAVETTFTDVTATREATDRIRRSEAQYRLLADNSADLITIRSTSHRLEYVSPSHAHVLGWQPEEMIGRFAYEFSHPEGRSHFPVMLAGTGDSHTLARVRHKAGHYLWLEAKTVQIHDERGNLTGYQTSARDVSERRALQEQLHYAQKMDALGRMARGVAHDFNNLLTVIRTSGEMMRQDDLTAIERGSAVGDVIMASERAAALTSQLLTFAERQYGTRDEVLVTPLLRTFLPLLRRMAGSNVAVDFTCGGDAEQATIIAEPVQVEQVVCNLVVNARDAMPSGGTIHVTCDIVDLAQVLVHRHGALSPGRYAVMAVADSGSGIDEDVLLHIFDPFYTTKPHGKGSGLGLATVLGIVHQANGTVTVSSVLGAGTTFTVYWPLHVGCTPPATTAAVQRLVVTQHVDESQRQRDEHSVTNTAAATEHTVLVVDDDPGVLKIVSSVLRRAGLGVETATSGAVALELIRQRRESIRAIVTDVRMPDMSGIELVDTLIAETIDLPVMFMSGQLDLPIPTAWPQSVPRAFISKPFAMTELAQRVKHMVGA